MAGIVLTSVTKTVRLYGRSTSPNLVRGTFALTVGGSHFPNLRVFEDDPGRSAQRLVTVVCPITHWSLDEAINVPSEVRLTKNALTVDLYVERVVAEVRAKGQFRQPERVRGQASSAQGPIRVYEGESSGERFVYLEGPSESLLRIAERVAKDGWTTLRFIEPSPDSPSHSGKITPD